MLRWLGAAVFALGCSGPAGAGGHASGARLFAPTWQNDGGKSIAALQARLKDAKFPEPAAVAIGVTRQGMTAIGLDGSNRWSYPTTLTAQPALSGALVVATDDQGLFALDAKSGQLLWNVPSRGRALRGAGDDGSITIASLGNLAGGGALLLAVDRRGKVVLDAAPGVETGAPEIVAGVAFIPWSHEYVSALDVQSRDEIARLTLSGPVSHVKKIGDALYFGQRSLVRFDAKIARAANGEANRVSLPGRELPGKPEWLDDGTRVPSPHPGARATIRVYARPEMRGEQLGIDSDRFAATYYRIAMGFDAKDASLAWVHDFEHEIVGGAAASDGFALCDADGNVWLIDRAGSTSKKLELRQPLAGCIVEPGKLAISPVKAAARLTEQIATAIQLRETDVTTAQRFLLRELGAMKEPVVTKTLIEIASNPRTPSVLLDDARKLLAARRSGAEYMLEALGRQYDFLSDVLRPPPVGPLADALAALNEKRAAPLLAKHLNDPANDPEDIERAARALAKLATAEQTEELMTFFALYRATADQKELVNAVLSVAEALLRVGGEQGQRSVRRAAEDPLTQPDVKKGLADLLPAEARPSAS